MLCSRARRRSMDTACAQTRRERGALPRARSHHDPPHVAAPGRTVQPLKTMADLLSAGSNHLADMLADWNTVLKHSRLGREKPCNINEGEDGNAPRDGRPAAVRRQKSA